MNSIRKIAVFIGFWLLLLAALFTNEVAPIEIKKQHSDSVYIDSKSYSSACIQPQTNFSFITNSKANDYINIAKYINYFPDLVPKFKTLSQSKYCTNQDINRCEMFSLLLFPFHYFW